MGTKKKGSVAEPNDTTPASDPGENGSDEVKGGNGEELKLVGEAELPPELALSDADRFQLLYFDAELRAARLEKQNLKFQIEEQARVNNFKLTQLTAQEAQAKKSLDAFRDELGKTYEVDLKRYAYNMESGRLNLII